MRYIVAYISALLFGAGLGIGGMTNPDNIIGFLDIYGDWQPALLLVMVGAVSFHAISYYLITRRATPLLDHKFFVPVRKPVDKRLIAGSALFGIGWGMGGYCPGPAITSLVSLSPQVLIFVVSMIGGMAIFHYVWKPFFLEEHK